MNHVHPAIHIPVNDDVNIPILRVSSTSPAPALAGSIAKALREQPVIHLQAIGMAAVYQATKAVIIARTYLAEEGLDLLQQPSFLNVEDRPGFERTVMRITLWVYPL